MTEIDKEKFQESVIVNFVAVGIGSVVGGALGYFALDISPKTSIIVGLTIMSLIFPIFIVVDYLRFKE